MKKILIFGAFLGFFACAPALCAVRDGAISASRAKKETATQSRSASTTARTVLPTRANATKNRAGVMRTGIVSRSLGTSTTRATVVGRTGTASPRAGYVPASTRAIKKSRAATTGDGASVATETRTGAAYNQCKTAYFQCMDQFCALKNDEYRRCSCSSRIYDLIASRTSLTETNEKLTEFTENLDIVGMTAAQATAIRTASDGENALTADTSASKALLTAIMNAIRGDDANVGGKMSGLNSINLSFDTNVNFNAADDAQLIASYNGAELYNTVYAACRTVVKDDCNDAALQRAVTAYLMAIEQDCNTLQTALGKKQKELKAAIREGGAMLDLARVQNRQKHNSDDKATCITNIENAILSEQVCGSGYHKCLDDGKFIDISTGAPIAGVVNFYELANMLSFNTGKNAADQKLAQNPANRTFVQNFENKTKKFAQDALDKCTEIADSVWQDYLDKALLDIYYAQRDKVDTIKTGCFDLISSCYQDRDASITAAMASLIDGTNEILLQPDKIVLTNQMCTDYIESCNNMFGDNIIKEYIANQTKTDTLAACRAVVDQCFANFGGANYENFYNPSSGLFTPNTADKLDNHESLDGHSVPNSALDWFTLYSYNDRGEREEGYVSECAKQLAAMPNCVDKIETVFGGLDAVLASQDKDWDGSYKYSAPDNANNIAHAYGWVSWDEESGSINWTGFRNRRLRPTGVATEVYNRIIDALTTQCSNVDGRFVEAQVIDHTRYGADVSNTNLCVLEISDDLTWYSMATGYPEYVCPKDYILETDTYAWGICSCWENGGRRSKYGKISKCIAGHPTSATAGSWPNSNIPEDYRPNDRSCKDMLQLGAGVLPIGALQTITDIDIIDWWCTSTINPDSDQVCPFNDQTNCETPADLPLGVRATTEE